MNRRGSVSPNQEDPLYDLRNGQSNRRKLFEDDGGQSKPPTSRDDETIGQNLTFIPDDPDNEDGIEDHNKGLSFYLNSVRSQTLSSKQISQGQSIILDEDDDVANARFKAIRQGVITESTKNILSKEKQPKFLFRAQTKEDDQQNICVNKLFESNNFNIETSKEVTFNDMIQLNQNTQNQETQRQTINTINAFENNKTDAGVLPKTLANIPADSQQVIPLKLECPKLPIAVELNRLPKRAESYADQGNLMSSLVLKKMAKSEINTSKVYSKKSSMILPLRQPAQMKTDMERSLHRSLTIKKKAGDRLNEVWKQRGLFILFFVRKFVIYLKNISSENKFRQLKKEQFEIFNDLANHMDYYKYENYLVSMRPTLFERVMFDFKLRISKYASLNSRFWEIFNTVISKADIVINPESIVKLLWDGFMLFLLVINIFYIPLKIAFEDSGGLTWPSMLVIFLNDVPGWAFIVDTMLNFTTSFYKKGVIITDRMTIVKHYLKNQFFWDLFVLIPFIVSLYFQIKYLDAILLLRFNRILKIVGNYLDLLNLKNDQAAVYDLCKLIVLILFIAHFCGCAFYLLSYAEIQSGSSLNWLDKFYKSSGSHYNNDWYSNYITSFYWAVITMITVGYGDIVPSTDIERIFVIIITLLSCGVFAYSVNSIGSIIGAITQKNTQFKQRMSLLTIHMNKRGLSTELQMKVKKYFEYLNDERLEDNQEGENMIQQLTGSLKYDIALEIYCKILNSKKLFKLNFSPAFLRDLAPKMKERRHGPEEIIYSQNEESTKLYFIMKGNVNLFLNVRQSVQQPLTIIRQVSKGGLFGELAFFSGMITDHGAITTNVVSLVYIHLEDFLEVLKMHHADHEKYTLIKDNFNLYSSSRGLGSQCHGCGKYTHQIGKCPMINYVPNKDRIIEKFKKQDEQQLRASFLRKSTKGLKPWEITEEMKQAVISLFVVEEAITNVEDLFHRLEEMEGPDGSQSEQQNETESLQESSEHQDRSPSKISRRDDFMQQSPLPSPSPLPELDQMISSLAARRKSGMKLSVMAPRGNFEKTEKQMRLAASHGYKTQTTGEENLQNSNINQDEPIGISTNILVPNFKERRAQMRRATFMKKQSSKKLNVILEDPSQDNTNNSNSIRIGKKQLSQQQQQLQSHSSVTRPTKSHSPTLSSSQMVQYRNAVASSLNLPLKEPTTTEMRADNTRGNTLNDIETKFERLTHYSKILDFDLPREFKFYYPKNNLSNTIAAYNNKFNVLARINASHMNVLDNPESIKDYYKNMKGNKKLSAYQQRKSGAGVNSVQTPSRYKRSAGNSILVELNGNSNNNHQNSQNGVINSNTNSINTLNNNNNNNNNHILGGNPNKRFPSMKSDRFRNENTISDTSPQLLSPQPLTMLSFLEPAKK